MADRPHGVVDATTAEAGLGDDEGLALAAEHAVGRQPDVVVVDECVHPLVLRLAASPMLRTMSTPGVSVGTRNIDAPW